MHQAPTTFDHAVTSDHRFFDRWAVGVQHPTAVGHLRPGQLQEHRRVRRLPVRAARRPPVQPAVVTSAATRLRRWRIGPLGIEVLEPLWSHRLVVEPTAASPLQLRAHLDRRTARPRGAPPPPARDGSGRAGLLPARPARHRVGLGGHRRPPARRCTTAFAWRDHSWGVRPGMGGTDPVTEHPAGRCGTQRASRVAVRLAGLPSGTGGGAVPAPSKPAPVEREDIDGHLIPDIDDPPDVARASPTSATTSPSSTATPRSTGPTCWSRPATAASGRSSTCRSVLPWVFSGGGYSGGWDDGQGLGVPRGVALEADEYDLPGSGRRAHARRERGPALAPGDRRDRHGERCGRRRTPHDHRPPSPATGHTRHRPVTMDAGELQAYLSSHLGPLQVRSFHRTFPGHSRETWIVDTDLGGLVVRVDHPGGPLVPIPMKVEYDVYERLWRSPIPVAEPLWYAEGVEFGDGLPHMVRRLVDGAPSVPGLTLSGDDGRDVRRAVCFEMAEKLAAVHTLDWRSYGFDEVLFTPSDPGRALSEEIHHWRALWAESRTDPFPMITEATYWLEEQLPPGGRPAEPAEGQQRRRRGDLEGRPHRRPVRLGAGLDRRAGARLGLLPGSARAARPRRHPGALRRAQPASRSTGGGWRGRSCGSGSRPR